MSDEITPATAAPASQPSQGAPGHSSSSLMGTVDKLEEKKPNFDLKDLQDEVEADKPRDNIFAFTPTQLYKLITAQSIAALDAFGGLQGLAAGLRTDISAGLSVDEQELEGTITFDEAVAAGRENRSPNIGPGEALGRHESFHLSDIDLDLGRSDAQQQYKDRRRIFGTNRLPKAKQKSFLALAWIAFNDKLIFLLTISATISLALGIYESVDAEDAAGKTQWVDGVTVVVAILVIVFASAATDWKKNRKFAELNERKEQRDVKVVRSGKTQNVSVYDVVVGDIMHVETGDVVAVDGILVSSAGVQVDESSLTGESELVHKSAARSSSELQNSSKAHLPDPFMISGTTVCGGIGTYLVVSTGTNTTYGRTLMSLRGEVEETPLQQKLGRLAKQLIVFGAVAGIIFFLIMFIRFCVGIPDMTGSPSEKAEAFFKVLILAVTVVIITVPEGLSLAVTLALAFATKRMLRDNNLVRLIRSCEIMGNATCICSDKTGTLTQNKMTVVVGRIGPGQFGDAGEAPASVGTPDSTDSKQTTPEPTPGHFETIPEFVGALTDDVKVLVKNSFALNSTAFENDDQAERTFVGTSTETALLQFGRDHLGMAHLDEERANGNIVDLWPFDASRKWMAVLRKLEGTRYRMLAKGAAEVVFDNCTHMLADPKSGMETQPVTPAFRDELNASIRHYASRMLRPVVIAYRDFEKEEDVFGEAGDSDSIGFDKHFNKLTFIGLLGIRDPLRPEVIDSVRQCQDAGVFVRMVTGDSFLTAKAIATDCGIYTAGGLAMDGPTFRKLTPNQLELVIPRLQVLARSSPEDKLLLVTHLKAMGETVAVTGDGTNDALALKAADVGFAMGIQGTEIAKEAASIILLDDNFKSIVRALVWGRTVNDATKKFLQFQFTINITAGSLTVISELAGNVIFSVVQLLWINLIMDIFASLGLSTDYPSTDFLKRKPEPRNAPIVSVTMWKMILLLAVYQLAVVFTFHYAGDAMFHPQNQAEREQLQTMVFNIYVWMQFFNQHNCRRVDNKINIWYQGVLRNPWFLGVQCLTLAGQMVIIWKGGDAFDTRPLSGSQWGWSMLFGALVIPLGALIRQIPDHYALSFFHACRDAFLAVRRVVTRPLPEKWRPKTEEIDAAESWMLETGAALLRPVQYQWGAHGHGAAPQPAVRSSKDEDAAKTSSPAQRNALSSSAAAAAAAAAGEEKKRGPEDEDTIDIVELVDLARYSGGATLPVNIEVHPATAKDDPFLQTPNSDGKTPPSQDTSVTRWLGIGSGVASGRKQ